MTQDDVKDPAGTPEPADTAGEKPSGGPPAAPEPAAPTPQPGGSAPAEPSAEPAVPASPAAPPEPTAPEPTAEPAVPVPPAAPPPGPTPTPEPVDEVSRWVRIGQVGSGRRLGPAEPALRDAIRDFASQRQLPGIGTLIDLARAHADSTRGPSLGVEAFTEIRGQLGRMVEDLEAVAIQVGPVLFLKTSAKNQPGTALRWLHADEQSVLREHPELLDHPGRLVANLRKRIADAD